MTDQKAFGGAWWTLAGPLVLSLLLGFWRVGVAEPHADFFTVLAAFPPRWSEFARDFLTPSGIYGGVYPPLYFAIAKAYGSIAGANLVALRMLSVLFLGTLVVVSWWGFPLLARRPSPMLRLWFATAVATAPAHIWWAQTAKYTMMLYLMYAVAMLAAFRFLQRRDSVSASWLALAMLGVFATHYVGFFFIAANALLLTVTAAMKRDRKMLRTLARAGAAAAVLSIPALPAVIQSLLWQRGGYHALNDASMRPLDLLRAALMHWNFGYSLLPRGGGVLLTKQVLFQVGDGALDLSRLPYLGPAIVGIVLLALSLGHAGWHAYRDPDSRTKALYLVGVVGLSLLLSATKGLSGRYVYLGFGTWATLAFLAVGWSTCRNVRLPLALGGGILALNGLSLAFYYETLHLKYPGSRIVVEYLREHADTANPAPRVLVDSWIVETRGSPLEMVRVPVGVEVRVVDSAAVLGEAGPSGNLAFLAGAREAVEQNLATQEAGGVRWRHLESFESMESRERSIHLYRLDR
jgi:4-amino-4-deoxy-L-arabinose transferase-like glycosyltransferase